MCTCQPAQTLSSRRMATPSVNSAPDPTPYLSGISPGTIPTCTTPLINYAEARLGGGQESPGCLRPDTPRLEDMWGVPRIAVAHQRADSLHACPQPGRAAVKLVGIIFLPSKISVPTPCFYPDSSFYSFLLPCTLALEIANVPMKFLRFSPPCSLYPPRCR